MCHHGCFSRLMFLSGEYYQQFGLCDDHWMLVIRYMQPVTSKIPIMVVEGNHEIEKQVENQTFVAYSSRFAFPSKESGSSSTFYYSFNAGGIHFIMLGGYIAYNKSGKHIRSNYIHWFTIHSISLNHLNTLAYRASSSPPLGIGYYF